MAKDKIGNISSEAEDKNPVEASISKHMAKSGKPMEHDDKMPHEHFTDKMAGKLTGDCY